MKAKALTTSLIMACIVLFAYFSAAEHAENAVVVGSITGEIGIASEKYVENLILFAERCNARLIILKIDTPGGEFSAIKKIITLFESSKIPVCVFVYPQGATAWSGGAFLLMASHIAVMASGASVGSAQPVKVTPAGISFTNQSKITNAVTALIKHSARLHGRNETIAEMFVTKNLNIGTVEAKKYGVIDFIADSLPELLTKLKDKVLILYEEEGELRWKLTEKENVSDYKLLWSFENISKSEIREFSEGPQIKILRIIANPLIAILMLIFGIYVFLIGVKTPGIGAEVLGVTMLFIALVGLGLIGVEWAGVLIVLTGFLLTLLELKTHVGLLLLGGAILIVLGSLMLIPSSELLLSSKEIAAMQAYIVATGAFLAALFAVIVYKVAKVQARKPYLGREKLIGSTGVAATDLDPVGEVRVMGEYWRARSVHGKISKGEKVRVVSREGLTLIVEKLKINYTE